jgi:hypothetical protein
MIKSVIMLINVNKYHDIMKSIIITGFKNVKYGRLWKVTAPENNDPAEMHEIKTFTFKLKSTPLLKIS